MITGTVLVDLSDVGGDFEARYRLAGLHLVPDGARLVLNVGASYVGYEALRLLLEHVDRLHVDVQGDPIAVRAWIDQLRSGGEAL